MEVVVLEAPLLVEAGWTSLVDEVWVTVAPEATVLKRLEEKVGLSRTKALARIRSQLPSEERIKHAHAVINTDCDLDELRAEVKEVRLPIQMKYTSTSIHWMTRLNGKR